MARGASLFGKATFIMDRGYDDNKMFLKLDSLKQDYVIRLTEKRRLFFHRKWVSATRPIIMTLVGYLYFYGCFQKIEDNKYISRIIGYVSQ